MYFPAFKPLNLYSVPVITLMSIFSSYLFFLFPGIGTVDLQLNLKPTRNDSGQVLINIYEDETNFPYHPSQSIAVPKSKLRDTNFQLPLALANGTYAITLLDDENNNGEMDYNWMGLPREGFGFSNNVKPNLSGPPSFEDCQFKIGTSDNQIMIKWVYF